MIAKALLFASLLFLASGGVHGTCRVSFCEASVEGDFPSTDATPDAWVVKSADPESDVELHDVYPASQANFSGMGMKGPFLKISAGVLSPTIVVHNTIVLPLVPKSHLFTVTVIVPFAKTKGSIRLVDNRDKVYFNQDLSKLPVGKWQKLDVSFNIRSPASAIRWKIDVSHAEAKKIIVLKNINVCAAQGTVQSVETLSVDELPLIHPARLGFLLQPWEGTGQLSVKAPQEFSQVTIGHSAKGNGSIFTKLTGLESSRCYSLSGQLKGDLIQAGLPIEVWVEASLLQGRSGPALAPVTENGEKWTAFSFRFCASTPSAKLTYKLKPAENPVVLRKTEMRKYTCKVGSAMVKRSFTGKHAEL